MFPIVPSHVAANTARQRIGGNPNHSGETSASDSPPWTVWTADFKAKDICSVSKKIPKMCVPNVSIGCDSDEAGGFAAAAIAKDTISKAIGPVDRYLTSSNRKAAQQQRIQFSVAPRGNFLQCTSLPDDKTPEHIWIRKLRLAMDVHSNNTILEVSTGDKDGKELRLRVLRNIEAGEELLLWFSEEILALMYIPFLTPANIRG